MRKHLQLCRSYWKEFRYRFEVSSTDLNIACLMVTFQTAELKIFNSNIITHHIATRISWLYGRYKLSARCRIFTYFNSIFPNWFLRTISGANSKRAYQLESRGKSITAWINHDVWKLAYFWCDTKSVISAMISLNLSHTVLIEVTNTY